MTFRESMPTGASSLKHARNTKNPRDLDLRPITLIFSRILETIIVHARAKFRQAKCSSLRVIVLTVIWRWWKLPSLPRTVIDLSCMVSV